MKIFFYILFITFIGVIPVVNANAAYRIGNTDVVVRAGLIERYDDNITYANTNKKKDFSTDLSIGFDVQQEAKLRSLRLNGNVNSEIFSKYNKYNNTSEDFTAEFFNEVSKYQRFSLKDTFLHAYEPRSFEDEFGRTNGRYSYYRNKLNCAYKHDITEQFNAGFGYSNEVDDFSRSDLSDSYMNKAALSSEYALSSATLIESAYSFEARDFDPGNNAYTNTVSLGLRQYLTKQVYIDAITGVDFIRSYDRTDYTKPLFNIMLTDELNETLQTRLAFNKQYYTNAYSDNVFDYWKVSGELKRRIMERLAVSGAGFYGKGKYPQSDITDDLTGGSISFIYDIRDNIKGSLAYNYSRTVSNIETREYTRNNIDLNIRIDF